MTVQVFYKNSDNSNNLALFVEDNFNVSSLKKKVSNVELSYIQEILKNYNLTKNILTFDLNSKKRIILINVKNNLKSFDVEKLGAEFYDFIKNNHIKELSINFDSLNKKNEKNFLGLFLHGLKLKSYEFNIYKSKKEKKIFSITIFGKKK